MCDKGRLAIAGAVFALPAGIQFVPLPLCAHRVAETQGEGVFCSQFLKQ